MAIRPIDANVAMKKIREYMEDFPKASTWFATCQVILSMLEDENQIPTLTYLNEPERAGLYGKYTVFKNEDGSPVTNCFVLRPAEDPAAVAALRAYAATTDNAELADDIINWVSAEPTEPLELEELRDMNVNAGKIIGTVNAMPGFNQLDDMLTCESCIYFDAAVAPCAHCIRSTSSEDFYCSSKTASINDAEDTNNVKID